MEVGAVRTSNRLDCERRNGEEGSVDGVESRWVVVD